MSSTQGIWETDGIFGAGCDGGAENRRAAAVLQPPKPEFHHSLGDEAGFGGGHFQLSLFGQFVPDIHQHLPERTSFQSVPHCGIIADAREFAVHQFVGLELPDQFVGERLEADLDLVFPVESQFACQLLV